ncbi:MAG: bifunctional aldolase/short-chain dehydrogenase [Phycisphaerales bacterium]|nr:bifunctional aldolase/short-chain dehydrogenase [Phycisphaerales bacterium]
MLTRWTENGAEDALARWGSSRGDDFALRLYTARLIGDEPDLVLHGGGNVSLKQPVRTILGQEVDALHVKASGGDLATIEPAGMPAVDLTYLRRLRTLTTLSDEEMVNQIRTHLFDAAAQTPSIETLLHAFLPHRFVDHSHADAVLVLTNQPQGESLIREALGDRFAVIPYIRPGFDLARVVADAYEANPHIEGVVLLHHGLLTFADDAKTSYERHIAMVDVCERFIKSRIRGRRLTVSFRCPRSPDELASRVAPMLRGLLATPTGDDDRPFVRPILEWRASKDIIDFVNSKEAGTLCDAGPLTSDHLIRTKPRPLFVEAPGWSDDDALHRQLHDAIDAYRRGYESYLRVHGASTVGRDSSPRVVFLPGAGMFCAGPTKRAARITADLAEHTLKAKTLAHFVGEFASLSDDHLFDMEFRTLQRAKLPSGGDTPLAGQIVAISGAAGAIGAAVAEVCAEAGAHVVLTDIDESRLSRVVENINERFGGGRVVGVPMDVTDEGSIRRGFDQIARVFGGVDVLVPNAGIAHVAPIDELALADFRRVMEINATGCFLFMREGARMLKRQALGGHIVVIASKNVFAPGKDFAAYSASKAASHQLGKVAAIELAPFGIRVNMINPDAVFGDSQIPSGLWETIAAQRAKSRNIPAEELPEFYRRRNLLKVRIHGRHVGNAVVFFASGATPTTGATLPVDGGIVEAFPR